MRGYKMLTRFDDLSEEARERAKENSRSTKAKQKAFRHEKILRAVKEHPGLTRQELSEKLGVSTATIWRHLKEQ